MEGWTEEEEEDRVWDEEGEGGQQEGSMFRLRFC